MEHGSDQGQPIDASPVLFFDRDVEVILEAAKDTPKPFIYRVTEKGRLNSVVVP